MPSNPTVDTKVARHSRRLEAYRKGCLAGRRHRRSQCLRDRQLQSAGLDRGWSARGAVKPPRAFANSSPEPKRQAATSCRGHLAPQLLGLISPGQSLIQTTTATFAAASWGAVEDCPGSATRAKLKHRGVGARSGKSLVSRAKNQKRQPDRAITLPAAAAPNRSRTASRG